MEHAAEHRFTVAESVSLQRSGRGRITWIWNLAVVWDHRSGALELISRWGAPAPGRRRLLDGQRSEEACITGAEPAMLVSEVATRFEEARQRGYVFNHAFREPPERFRAAIDEGLVAGWSASGRERARRAGHAVHACRLDPARARPLAAILGSGRAAG